MDEHRPKHNGDETDERKQRDDDERATEEALRAALAGWKRTQQISATRLLCVALAAGQ